MRKLTLLLIILVSLAIFSACVAQDSTTDSSGGDSTTNESTSTYEKNTDWAKAYARVIENTDLLTDAGIALGEWDYSPLEETFQADFYFSKYTLFDSNNDGEPELYLYLPKAKEDTTQIAVVIIYNEGDYPEPIGYVALNKYNPNTKELITQGHWHGAGGSGDNEWQGYIIENNELKPTFYFDNFNGKISIDSDGSSGSQQDYDSLYDKHVKSAEDISSWSEYDLTDPKGFDNYGGAPDNFYHGKELNTYRSAIDTISNALKGENVDYSAIPGDLTEGLNQGLNSAENPCYYALYDLDEDGIKEMIIGIYKDNGELTGIIPSGIYTIRDNKPYLFNELSYFQGIIEKKWIHTLQGGGLQEGHEDGYMFIIEKGELKEVPVSEAAGGNSNFTWQKIE